MGSKIQFFYFVAENQDPILCYEGIYSCNQLQKLLLGDFGGIKYDLKSSLTESRKVRSR